MFERYSEEETGIKGNWLYLSDERKSAWMEEALLSVELVVTSMQETVKPLPPLYKFDTVWEQGRYSGQYNERTVFIGYLHDVLENCKEELENFKSAIKN